MTSDPTDLICEGREKLAAATPGDWLIHDRGIGVEVHAPNGADSTDPDGTHCLTDDDVFDERYVPGSTANAEFIVWARNNMAAVLEALRAEQKDGEIIANTLDEERAYSAHLRDEVTRAKEWQGIGVATRFAEFREAQRWAEWFAAERDDAQQWSQHFEHEMREAQVSVVQFQQECTAQFPDLDDNCGPDEVASAIHMLRVERNNAAIRNMQENNFQCEAALAEANATIQRALEACDYLEDGPMQAAVRYIRRAIEGEQS